MNFPRILGCPCAPIDDTSIFNFFRSNVGEKGYTVAINAEKILKYQTDIELQEIINGSLLPYPDGAGAVIGLRWLHSLRAEKINMPILSLEYVNQNYVKTFIVGASEEVHDAAIKVIRQRYPNIHLVGHMHGFSSKELMLDNITSARPALVLLALGSPRQEKFAAQLLERIDSGIIIGCGGALDILAGKIKRAPKLFIDNNMEWAFRVIQEPWRLRRVLFLPNFLLALSLEVVRSWFSKT